MARGNQRELSREKNLKKKMANDKNKSHAAPKVGGVNTDKDALAQKIAAKKKAKEDAAAAGVETKVKDRGSQYVATEKVVNAVNPHTGRKDAKFNAKLQAKGVALKTKGGGAGPGSEPGAKKKAKAKNAANLPPELMAAMAAGKKKKKKKPGALASAQGAAKAKVAGK